MAEVRKSSLRCSDGTRNLSASRSTSEPVKLMPWPVASQCFPRSDHGGQRRCHRPASCASPTSLPVLTLQSLPITGRSCVASIQPPKPMRRPSASEYHPTLLLPPLPCPGAGLQEPLDHSLSLSFILCVSLSHGACLPWSLS